MNFLERLSKSWSLAHHLIRRQWLPVLVLFGTGLILGLYVEDSLSAMNPTDDDYRWVYQVSLGLWDLFEGVALFIALSMGITRELDLQAPQLFRKVFAEPYLSSFLAEYLRMLAQTILWGLMLIVPGMWRYGQLIWVPYIALFSSEYRAGRVDALKLSTRLSQGRMRLILTVLVVTTAIQLGLEFAPHLSESLHTVTFRLITSTLSFLIGVWTYSFLFLMFQEAITSTTPD